MQIAYQYCFIVSLFSIYSTLSQIDPQFAAVMSNITVVAGREVKLLCIVENLQNFKVAWVHYGDHGSAVLTVGTHVLTTNRRVTVAAERDAWALLIANATVVDRGEYMCQISTVPPKKMYTALQVLVPPHIDVPPGDITVNETENVTLECQATGDPTPKITWRREENSPFNGYHIPEGEDKGPLLSLVSVSRSMAGPYLCVASNGVPPAVSARAILNVNYGPIAIGKEDVVTWAPRGEETHLECRFEAFPEPKIVWSHFHNQVSKEFKIETKFSPVNRLRSIVVTKPQNVQDFGIYKCAAENRFGAASISFTLKERLTTTTSTTTTTAISSTKNLKSNPSSWQPIQISPLDAGKLEQSSKTRTDAGSHESLFEFGIRESKAGKEDESESPSTNKTKNEHKARKIETSSPKRFVQESPFGHLYPIDDSDGYSSSSRHRSSYLCLWIFVGLSFSLISTSALNHLL